MQLYREAENADLKYAEEHRDIIRRFGRFPHRNPILGRQTTPEEQTFLDVDGFTLVGRRYRNLRQAVQRTHNSGVTTDIVVERDLDERLRAELLDVVAAAGKGTPGRGFAMILDGLLSGEHPGTFIALARGRTGEVVAFQRYCSADGGRELSLDVPWRRPDAPHRPGA